MQVERLGDTKQPVRQTAGQILTTLMRVLTTPTVLERLIKLNAFEHKSWRVRESILLALSVHIQSTGLADFDKGEIERTLLPRVAARLQDGQAEVRFAVIETLCEMHACLGEALVHMLSKHQVRPSQMKELHARFEARDPALGSHPECASLSASFFKIK